MSLLNDIVGNLAQMQATTRLLRAEIMIVLTGQEFQGMTPRLQPPLGPTVLVVEDHALIALDLETMLLDLGAAHVTISTTVEQAIQMLALQNFDAAFLDVRLGENTSLPVAVALRAKGIPFAVATGYDTAVDINADFKTVPLISKPYNKQVIADVWQTLVGAGREP
jgi:CheY-like chemotaxis protein